MLATAVPIERTYWFRCLAERKPFCWACGNRIAGSNIESPLYEVNFCAACGAELKIPLAEVELGKKFIALLEKKQAAGIKWRLAKQNFATLIEKYIELEKRLKENKK